MTLIVLHHKVSIHPLALEDEPRPNSVRYVVAPFLTPSRQTQRLLGKRKKEQEVQGLQPPKRAVMRKSTIYVFNSPATAEKLDFVGEFQVVEPACLNRLQPVQVACWLCLIALQDRAGY